MKSCPLAVKRGFYHTSQYNPDTEEQKSDMKFSSNGNLTLHGKYGIKQGISAVYFGTVI